jgi:hypothetical protein
MLRATTSVPLPWKSVLWPQDNLKPPPLDITPQYLQSGL